MQRVCLTTHNYAKLKLDKRELKYLVLELARCITDNDKNNCNEYTSQ